MKRRKNWKTLLLWIGLKFILSKLLVQGFDHKNNLVNIHRNIHDALAIEFTEDSEASREAFDFQCRTTAWSGI